MHSVWFIVAAVTLVITLLAALIGIVFDLMERASHGTSVIGEDGMNWPNRYRGAGSASNGRAGFYASTGESQFRIGSDRHPTGADVNHRNG